VISMTYGLGLLKIMIITAFVCSFQIAVGGSDFFWSLFHYCLITDKTRLNYYFI